MKRDNSRRAEEDEFLRSLIGPAAEEYAQLLAKKAEDPPLRIPAELDEKCRRIIETHRCSRTSRIRVALVAAAIAALLGMTSFAVYSEVRRELVMKRQEADEGCRITFDGTDGDAETYDEQALSDVTLNYIPDGFECYKRTTDFVRYKDEHDNFILFKKRKVNSSSLLLRDKENAGATPINHCGYEGYKEVKYCLDGRIQIDYFWLDTNEQIVYEIVTVGIGDNEWEKILEGASYYNEDD
ncbi:MAG: hypothetical protein IJE90_01400 [Clostridia bacterium]|nr:hypothetical protein [Clostridia bacterium]